MFDPENVPAIEKGESLARFVFSRSHVRSDGTIKPDAFIPFPHSDLSVTRQLQITREELLIVGEGIATQRQKKLFGWADIGVDDCEDVGLTVQPAPINGNPNHADITGWPPEKHTQKLWALQLAAQAQYSENK